MIKVTNNSDTPLHVGGVLIPPGKTLPVTDPTALSNPIVKSWRNSEMISVDGEVVAAVPPPPPAPVPAVPPVPPAPPPPAPVPAVPKPGKKKD